LAETKKCGNAEKRKRGDEETWRSGKGEMGKYGNAFEFHLDNN